MEFKVKNPIAWDWGRQEEMIVCHFGIFKALINWGTQWINGGMWGMVSSRRLLLGLGKGFGFGASKMMGGFSQTLWNIATSECTMVQPGHSQSRHRVMNISRSIWIYCRILREDLSWELALRDTGSSGLALQPGPTQALASCSYGQKFPQNNLGVGWHVLPVLSSGLANEKAQLTLANWVAWIHWEGWRAYSLRMQAQKSLTHQSALLDIMAKMSQSHASLNLGVTGLKMWDTFQVNHFIQYWSVLHLACKVRFCWGVFFSEGLALSLVKCDGSLQVSEPWARPARKKERNREEKKR